MTQFYFLRHWFSRAAIVGALLFASAPGSARGEAVNNIQSIKTTKAGTVEITITSGKPFLQSDLPVLRIGDQEFTISRYADDGSLNTLIFTLTADDFANARTGEKVVFQYGSGEGRNQRDFGALDKSKRSN
jgi:hypothetical protein